ncbi:putative galactosyltransferase [Zymoseptoria tritici IPO323]|uniref:Galactosyltransferase n=1 Tax=Zymoseptoria tritici (strain CBS 115943 / IPO323) TaxID=336722 RepID=F9XA08_ZYMTI|nr:putative galactosyltransferase [Zymoseptoria tritici IPO323]EGP88294.1 putative galactosyltransferase [Zymoseptoria tritici IPO323]
MILVTPSPGTAKLLIIAGVTSFLLLALYGFGPSAVPFDLETFSTPVELPQNPPCQLLPGAEDILVVMRTGATEIKDKLPAHIETTFKCFKNLVIFSDYNETFLGYPVHDVLSNVNPEIKDTNQDFEIYRHIREVGREGLNESELSGAVSAESGPVGKNDNAGWRLDKWKFLPMANETLHMYPDFKWYVFVEPDTYLVWSSLLQWLPTLDSGKASYFGSEVMIGDDMFGHGGSSFVISKPALEKAAESYNKETQRWNDILAGHWAGDAVLGKLLDEAGARVTATFPMIQGGNFYDQMDWDGGNDHNGKLWCRPALSYHHFTPDEVREFWKFEQTFIQHALIEASEKESTLTAWREPPMAVLHHRDVFKLFVQPAIAEARKDWNNTAEQLVSEDTSVENCRNACLAKDDCKQYAVGPAGCSIGNKVRIGSAQTGTEAWWLTERIQEWVYHKDKCHGQEGWSVS